MGCTATETLLDTVRPGSKRQEKDSGEDTERKDVSQKRDYKEEFDPFTEFDEYIDEIIENDENVSYIEKEFYIIRKYFEANNINSEKLKNLIDDEYNKLNKENDQNLFYNIFKNILKINNETDAQKIENLFMKLMDKFKNDNNKLKEFIYKEIQKIVDYSTLDKNKINEMNNTIASKLNEIKENIKKFEIDSKLESKNYIISFEDFNKFVLDEKLSLSSEEMEYLLYKMKSDLNEKNSLYELNFKILSNFLDNKYK